MPEQVIGFASEQAFQRVADAVKHVERTRRFPRLPRGKDPIIPGLAVGVGKIDSTVTQGQFGTVSVYTGEDIADDTDLTDTGENVQALFLLGDGEAGLWVILVRWLNIWIAVNSECPA